jgi:hypothetical protein
MSRVALLAPGRGSYTERSLHSLDARDELVRVAEDLRAGYGLEPLVALDAAPRFEPARHLRPANAAALIYLCSVLDARPVLAREEVACIAGNSLGWYTALALAGALSFEDGFRLVQEMALLQEEGEPGGQLIYPVMDAEWRPDPNAEAAVAQLLARAGASGPRRGGGPRARPPRRASRSRTAWRCTRPRRTRSRARRRRATGRPSSAAPGDRRRSAGSPRSGRTRRARAC